MVRTAGQPMLLAPAVERIILKAGVDASTLAGAAAILSAAGKAACYFLARRAGKVDPMPGLNSD